MCDSWNHCDSCGGANKAEEEEGEKESGALMLTESGHLISRQCLTRKREFWAAHQGDLPRACADLQESLQTGLIQAWRLADLGTGRITDLRGRLEALTEERDRLGASLEEMKRERDRLQSEAKRAGVLK